MGIMVWSTNGSAFRLSLVKIKGIETAICYIQAVLELSITLYTKQWKRDNSTT